MSAADKLKNLMEAAKAVNADIKGANGVMRIEVPLSNLGEVKEVEYDDLPEKVRKAHENHLQEKGCESC
ncbi:hypothetical protein [Gracilimonas sediminicola]|uniref:hypothetical protein n=1 Tax=Gracilimonas sediminicola TaxID=2952158 RepID=UPI0038D43811